ncbi:carbohydrate kinase family protein [Kribbella sp. NPDC054772]
MLLHVLKELHSDGTPIFSQLHSGRHDVVAPLLDLAAVRRYADAHAASPEVSALAVVGDCVRELAGTEQIVADAALGVGAFVDEYALHQIDRRSIRELSDAALSRRRRMLLETWPRFHEALGHQRTEVPTETDLRESLEPAALRAVAHQLVRRDVYSAGSTNSIKSSTATRAERTRGRIIVVGSAVMDVTLRISDFPRLETSTEADDCAFTPGGKGLTQAVAAARLGHEVSLVAAIADDRWGMEIISYLRKHNVDTSLLKVVPDARTPITCVLEMDLGESAAAYWRNDKEIRLDPWDCDELIPEFAACDALLTTFEVPRETVEHVLAELPKSPEDRPLTIVTAAQPRRHARLGAKSLERVDYLVAHPWELQRLASGSRHSFDPDAGARSFLESGVTAVCLMLRGGCTVYSRTAHDVIQAPVAASVYKESAAARDAYCAALADGLIQSNRQFSRRSALWASAAMSAAIADFPLPNSLPSAERIEASMARSQFER